MKKIFYILCFVCIIFLSGCNKEEYFICKINVDNDIQEYHLSAVYKVYHEKSFVTKIEKEERYISKKEETLNYFEQYKDLEYKNLNNLYGGVTYSIGLEENKVILNATIDMSLVDVEKMVKDNYLDEYHVNSNKLTTGGIKMLYEQKGATCDI